MKRKKKNSRQQKPLSHPSQRYLQPPSRLSLCMIVKNEAENLAPCIQTVKPVLDEIIVVDTGSTDRTKEIAAELGAKVFDFPWCDDFSAARNASIQHATGDYILWMDADDRLDDSEVQKIALLKKILPRKKNKAYFFVVNNQSPVDGETHFYQMRIFPKIAGALFEGRVHEQIIQSLLRLGVGQIQTDIILRHTGYHDKAVVKEKSERNLQMIQKELEANPDHPIWHYNAARTLAGIGRQAEAVVHLRKVITNEKIRTKEKRFYLEASLLLGRFHIELEQYEEARDIFEDLARNFADDPLIHFCLGESLFLLKDYKRAKEELKKSFLLPLKVSFSPINRDRFHFYQYYLLGQCYAETEEINLAKEMLQKSLGLHRDQYKSLQALGLLAMQKGEFQETAQYYEKAIREGGGSDSNYANLGLAYHKMGLAGQAEGALLKALELNPQKSEALINLGHLYRKEKAYPKALAYLLTALALAPNRVDVRLALSDIYFRLQELEKLVAQCDALLKELNLPRNFTLSSLDELSFLFQIIAKELGSQGRGDLSFLAYQVSFLISPSLEVLEKLFSLANSSGTLKGSLEEIAEALQFHGKGVLGLGPLETLGDHLSSAPALGEA